MHLLHGKLLFCLDEGAAVVRVDDAQSAAASDETLEARYEVSRLQFGQ